METNGDCEFRFHSYAVQWNVLVIIPLLRWIVFL